MVRRLFGSSSSAVQNTVTLLSPAQLVEAAMSQEELMQVSRVIDFKMDQPVGEAPPKKIPRPKTKRRSHIHNQNSSDSSNSSVTSHPWYSRWGGFIASLEHVAQTIVLPVSEDVSGTETCSMVQCLWARRLCAGSFTLHNVNTLGERYGPALLDCS